MKPGKEDYENLRALNDAVEVAQAARSAWLKETVGRLADVKIGETLFSLTTFKEIGVVEGYQTTYDEDSLEFSYKVRHPSGSLNDVYADLPEFGTREQALERARQRFEDLQRSLAKPSTTE